MILLSKEKEDESLESEPQQHRSFLSDSPIRKPANYWSSLNMEGPLTQADQALGSLAPSSNHRSPWYQ